MEIVKARIENKLRESLQPKKLVVINESDQHNVPAGSESHFKVVLVSDVFAGKRQVARHQMVYAALAEEMAGPVHALALHTYAPDETLTVLDSPPCAG